MKTFSLYRRLKPYPAQGYKVIYINLVWVWFILSCVIATWFIYQYGTEINSENRQREKVFGQYANYPIELELPKIITKILEGAKSDSSKIDLTSYYQIKEEALEKENKHPFDLSLLEKSKNSNQWFLQVLPSKPFYQLLFFSSKPNQQIIYNKDWLIYYRISSNEILENQIGSSYNIYFDNKIEFKDHKLYQLLTWNPGLAVFLLGALKALLIIFLCYAGVGLTIWLLKALIIRYLFRNHLGADYDLRPFLSYNIGAIVGVVGFTKGYKYLALKTLQKIHIYRI